MYLPVEQAKQIAKLLLADERGLRAGANVQTPVILPPPRHTAMRLEVHLLYPRRLVRRLVDDVGFLESLLDAAKLAVNIDIDVVAICDAFLLVQDGRGRLHRC